MFLDIFHVFLYCFYFLICDGSTHNNYPSIYWGVDNFLTILAPLVFLQKKTKTKTLANYKNNQYT